MAGARPKSVTYKGSEEINELRKSVTPSMYKGSEEVTELRKSVTPSMYKGSEEVTEYPCTPCARRGLDTEADNFCTDCSEFLCPSCTGSHMKLGITATHNVVDRNTASPAQLPTERCKEHNGELVTNFCKDHDLVVCNLCVTVDHRTCETVNNIPNIAGKSQARQTVPKVKSEVIASLKVVQTSKINIQKRTPVNDQNKEKHLKAIKEHTLRVIEHARVMEQSAIAEVNKYHQETAHKIASELALLDDSEAMLQQRLKSLDNAQSNNDSQVFVDTKMGKTDARAAIQLQQRLQSSGAENIIKSTFVLDDGVDVFLNGVTSLGKVITPFKAVLKGCYDIKDKGDEKVCYITDACELPNGDILITDYYNDCIKVFNNESNKITKRFKTKYRPLGICQTGQSEIAVTLPERKTVQFVDISGSWKTMSSFTMEESCWGIISSKNELIISCAGSQGNGPAFIVISDIYGKILKQIQPDNQNSPLFSDPRHLVATHNGTKIHVADYDQGVITVNRSGDTLSTVSQNIWRARGVCAVGRGSLVVCGYWSHNVIQLTVDGEYVTELLSKKDGLSRPVSVMYSPSRSMLIVTSQYSNEIKMFDLQV